MTSGSTFLASYGAFEKEKHRNYFYTLELSQNKSSLTDFEITSLHLVKGETRHNSVEVLSRGLGFEFALLRLSADAGFLFSMDKYALDEIDYGISRSVVGLNLSAVPIL